MLEILSHEIEEPILMAIRSSQAISLQIDESTDVSVSRQLDLHVRYAFIFFVRITCILVPVEELWILNAFLTDTWIKREKHLINFWIVSLFRMEKLTQCVKAFKKCY